MKAFKDYATDMKQNEGPKFSAMYKYIMSQKNMDRIQTYIIDSLVESKEIEDIQNKINNNSDNNNTNILNLFSIETFMSQSHNIMNHSEDWKLAVDAWFERRYLTAKGHLKTMVNDSFESSFFSDAGKWEVEGLKVYMSKLMGVAPSPNMTD